MKTTMQTKTYSAPADLGLETFNRIIRASWDIARQIPKRARFTEAHAAQVLGYIGVDTSTEEANDSCLMDAVQSAREGHPWHLVMSS